MLGGRLPLVGRDAELAALRAARDDAVAGAPRVVLVRGEAGIGKTQLVRALLDGADDTGADPVRAATGHCAPILGGELPYGPVVELLQGLSATGTDLLAAAGPAAEAVRPLLVGGADGPSSSGEGQGLARSRLFAGVLRLLGEAALDTPLVLVLEDLHWSDAASLDLVVFLARALRRERLLLLLTWRDGPVDGSRAAVVGELLRVQGVTELALTGLPAAALSALLEAARAPGTATGLTADARRRIVERSDGNPFLALELLARGDDPAVPRRLRDLLLADLGGLPEAAREVLGTCALLGDTIEHDLLAACTELPPVELAAALRPLVDRALLRASGDGYAFRHALVREVVVEDMTAAERGLRHDRVVGGLRQRVAAGATVRAAELAHHLVGAGRRAEALPVVLSAAQDADRLFAPAEARRHYDVARQLWPQVPEPQQLTGVSTAQLVCRSALATRRADAPEQAVALLESGLDAPLSDGERALLEQALGDALWSAGRAGESLAAYERAAEAARSGAEDAPSLAEILTSRAKGLMLSGRLEEAAEQAREAVGLAAAAGSPRPELDATITLGVAEALRGASASGLDRLRAGVARARELGDVELLLRCAGNLTYVLVLHGDYEEAWRTAQQAEQVCRPYGPPLAVAGTLVNNGVWALVALGRWDEAEAAGRAALAEWSPHGDGVHLHLTLAEVAVARGDAALTSTHLASVSRSDDPYVLGALAAVEAERLLLEGAPGAAEEQVRQALDRLQQSEDGHLELTLRALALRALADSSRGAGPAGSAVHHALRARADADLDAARRAGSASDLAPERALVLQCEAEAARLGHDPAAPELWARVGDAYLALSRPYPRAVALWQLAGAWLGAHARTAALPPLREALLLSRELGARPLEAALTDLATAGGLLRELPDESPPVEVTAPDHPAVRLTDRERQVLELLTRGSTNRQIARSLYIAEKTVSVHVSNLLAKLGASNRVEAVHSARLLGLVA